jgi:hypothetical protein
VGRALGDILPLAVAVAVFPVPIIVAVLLLGSDRGTAKGAAYALSWSVGLFAVGGIVLVLGGGSGGSRASATAHPSVAGESSISAGSALLSLSPSSSRRVRASKYA